MLYLVYKDTEQFTIFLKLKMMVYIYIYICQLSGHTITEHAFDYYSNHTIFGGDIGYIYCVTFYSQSYAPIILLEKRKMKNFRHLVKQ